MKQEKGSALFVELVVIVVLILGVGIYLLFTTQKTGPLLIPPQKGGQLTQTELKGDINRDGKIDSMDADLIKKASPCNHVDPCWKKVVSKTKDGDNPIYTSDLDLNHDDNVNELDISAMSVGQ